MSDQQKDNSTDFLYIMFALVAIVLIIYYFFNEEIIKFYLTFKLWEIKLISPIYSNETTQYIINEIENRPLGEWTFSEVSAIGGYIGQRMNILWFAIVGYLTYKVWKKNPLQKFRRVFNMKTLKQSEQPLWPYIAPVIDTDLINEPFDKGPYAMAITPYDYAVKYKLLTDENNTASMDKVKAEKLFASQLGKLWGGFNRLKKHEQALMAIMAAHGCGDKKGAMKAIGDIALSAKMNPKRMPDFSSVEPLLKYIEDPAVQDIINKHAYIYTILAQMMEFSRTTGVFPPSYIIWLKPRDRVLFYVLNCVGRQVAFVEVAGIFGHWKSEQIANHKLEAPYVAKAVDGFERALSEVKIKPK